MTALIVPVASTASLMSPRSTLAVKRSVCTVRFKPKAMNKAVRTAAASKIIHLPLLFIFPSLPTTRLPASLVSQGFYWIEQRCLPCGVISEKDSHGDREHRCHQNRFDRHLHRPVQRLSNQIRTENSKQNSCASSHEAQHDGLAEKLQLNRF